jgi:hypothetical protein
MCGVLLLMPQIDLIKLLSEIKDYVLIKKSKEFPDYYSGSDIDLLAMDKDTALRRVVDFYESNYSLIGELEVTDKEYHRHIDFLTNGKLDIRVDLIHNFDFFTKFSVKSAFFIKVFKDRQVVDFNNGSFYIPAPEDDLTIRYFEYLEYFDHYPNKLKHLDYICDIKDQLLKRRFFENTHRFIDFKRAEWKQENNISPKPESINMALKNIYINSRYLISASIKNLAPWTIKLYRSLRG